MTRKFNRSAGNQYVRASDSANFTYPNSNWVLAFLVVLNGTSAGIPVQYLISNGGFATAGSMNVALSPTDNPIQPGRITCYIDTTANANSPTPVSSDALALGNAYIVAVQRNNNTVCVKTCQVLTVEPTDGSAVKTGVSVPLTSALDGPSGMYIGGRADLGDRWADQSIGRVFSDNSTLTDFEIAKLAFGYEITDLGRTPKWYLRIDDATDITDRGTQANTFTSNGAVVQGASPGFGYVAPAPTSPTVSAAPIDAERIFQRSGTALAILMSGLWAVTKPDAIEYQLYAEDRTTVLLPWTAIPGVVINSNGTWSGSPLVPQGGMYYRRVRSKSGNTVIATGDIENSLFGVGDLGAVFGSSSAEKYFDSNSGTGFTPLPNVRKFNENGWQKFGTDGCAIALANALSQQSGVPIGLLDYGVGGTMLSEWIDQTSSQWLALKDGIQRVGAKLKFGVSSVGSNDAAKNNVASRASHLGKLRQLFSNVRQLTGQTTLDIFQSGFNRRTYFESGTAASFNMLADMVRMAENDVGFDANVYNIQTLQYELSPDGTHLTPAGFLSCNATTGTIIGRRLYGDGKYLRGPRIASISYLGAAINVALEHRNGNDFTPATGITGFTATDSTGALSLTATRKDAGNIAITADRTVVGTLSLKYLSGSAPAVGTQVFDNGTLALPMMVETDLSATAIDAGDTTAPVLSNPTASATGQNTATASVSTNEAGGVLYSMVSTNATEQPGTVKAGQSATVSLPGTQSVSSSGLSAGSTYYAHFLHRDAAGNESTIANSAAFVTVSAPPVSGSLVVTARFIPLYPKSRR